jgi:hypothetical protein
MFWKEKIVKRLRTVWRVTRNLVLFCAILFLAAGSTVPAGGPSNRVEALTRPIAFDFGTWTLDALAGKLSSWGFSFERFLTPEQQSQWVRDTLEQVQQVQILNAELLLVYSDPDIEDPDVASQDTRVSLDKVEAALAVMAPVAESILQSQLMDIINQIGLTALGQTVPPSLYQSSEIPHSLVVSPRDKIEQSQSISLLPGITAEDMDHLENEVFTETDQSALVVPIGGIGTYPTMVMQTADLAWLTEVIAHEWVHNYLTFHPLGINYDTTPALRTINETTASLAGKELSRLILAKYYPEILAEETLQTESESAAKNAAPEPAPFDFRTEMRLTRVEVDKLLAEGKIQEAENYMEARRLVFWENGFPIRKLNQAYFAFYGAYNDTPGGGASGEDPVGPAVQAYRDQFSDLASFLRAIAKIDSFEALLARTKVDIN